MWGGIIVNRVDRGLDYGVWGELLYVCQILLY